MRLLRVASAPEIASLLGLMLAIEARRWVSAPPEHRQTRAALALPVDQTHPSDGADRGATRIRRMRWQLPRLRIRRERWTDENRRLLRSLSRRRDEA
jgi:hypothetical protein